MLLAVRSLSLPGVLGWSFVRLVPSAQCRTADPGPVRQADARSQDDASSKLDEQLPDAVDVIEAGASRGPSFRSSALRLVAEGMPRSPMREVSFKPPSRTSIAGERRSRPRHARACSCVCRAYSVTAWSPRCWCRKETSGNLAQIFDQVSRVIRSRFCFVPAKCARFRRQAGCRPGS